MTDTRERLDAARRIIERAACNDQYRGGSREAVLDAVEALCVEVQRQVWLEHMNIRPTQSIEERWKRRASRLVRGKDGEPGRATGRRGG